MTITEMSNNRVPPSGPEELLTRYAARERFFKDAELTDAQLAGADLRGADLRGSDMRGANLSGADLTGSCLRGANLTGAKVAGTNFSGADVTGAWFTGVEFHSANNTDWSSVKGLPAEYGSRGGLDGPIRTETAWEATAANSDLMMRGAGLCRGCERARKQTIHDCPSCGQAWCEICRPDWCDCSTDHRAATPICRACPNKRCRNHVDTACPR